MILYSLHSRQTTPEARLLGDAAPDCEIAQLPFLLTRILGTDSGICPSVKQKERQNDYSMICCSSSMRLHLTHDHSIQHLFSAGCDILEPIIHLPSSGTPRYCGLFSPGAALGALIWVLPQAIPCLCLSSRSERSWLAMTALWSSFSAGYLLKSQAKPIAPAQIPPIQAVVVPNPMR